jgi:hypothetical protein
MVNSLFPLAMMNSVPGKMLESMDLSLLVVVLGIAAHLIY